DKIQENQQDYSQVISPSLLLGDAPFGFYLITVLHQSPFFDFWKFAPISNGKGLDLGGGLCYAFFILGICPTFFEC
ncbi:MAG: hypothetical protein ACKO8M_18025, partial [Microcystis panniformis]